MTSRILSRLALIVGVVVATSVLAQPSAEATPGDCISTGTAARCTWDGPLLDRASFVVDRSAVFPTAIHAEGQLWFNGDQALRDLYVIVYIKQCRGDGSACGNLGATSQRAISSSIYPSVDKPWSTGHIYYACGSAIDYTLGWRSVLNVCSPPIAIPT